MPYKVFFVEDEIVTREGIRDKAEICYQIGYSDPHYFSSVFRKNTGLSPTRFRLQVQV